MPAAYDPPGMPVKSATDRISAESNSKKVKIEATKATRNYARRVLRRPFLVVRITDPGEADEPSSYSKVNRKEEIKIDASTRR